MSITVWVVALKKMVVNWKDRFYRSIDTSKNWETLQVGVDHRIEQINKLKKS